MSFIIIDKNDVVIGEPSPWVLYDRNHNVLVKQGSVVRDAAHLNNLLSQGACRELEWDALADEDMDDPFADVVVGDPFAEVVVEDPFADGSVNDPFGEVVVEDPFADGSVKDLFADESVGDPFADEAAVRKTKGREGKGKGGGVNFTFNDMKLKVEDKLQLQPPEKLSRERFSVRVIGFSRGVSLMVSTPVTAKGIRLQLMEGETVVMRFFMGQNAFAFVCTILRVCKTPFEYMHLSFPEAIQGLVIRKAPRVKVRIIATVQNSVSSNTEERISALISDISANGAGLDSKQLIGSKGDIVNMSFRVKLHDVDTRLSINGVICTIIAGDAADSAHPGLIRHGIQFHDLKSNDRVILQSIIYQHMIENPHHLI